MRYFIGFLVTIGLIILLIVLLFGGGGNKSKTPSLQPLPSYATTDAVAQLTIDGPINAAQNHDQIQITVGRDDVTFEHLKGYDGSVASQQTFANTTNAYSNFLHALAVAGYTHGNASSSSSNEEGYCPLGDRYVFELSEGGSNILRYWSTSCGSPKTYNGNTDLTLILFKNQVPNYNSLASNINL